VAPDCRCHQKHALDVRREMADRRSAFAATHSAKRPRTFRAKEAAAIVIAVSLIGLALAALAATLIAAKSGGFVSVVAQALAVILASLTGALIGFFIPLIPLADGIRGSALAAGILRTLGTIGGMTAAENLMARLEKKR
jgi:CBS domain containing-hemolysin-like protein